jgi:hypothetical protein
MRVGQARLQQLLLDEPAVAAELRRVLDEALTPVLTSVEQARIGTLVMQGSSRDSSTFTQVAGDQYSIHLPPVPPLPAMCTLPGGYSCLHRARQGTARDHHGGERCG